MMRYETLILATPEITARETANLEEQFEALVKKTNGSVSSFDRWGKYKLAYPVRKNDYGVYFLSRFEIEEEKSNALMKDLESLFKLKFPQVVMRFMNSKLDPNKPLEYQKPESLEDIPSQDVDKFLRENKMEGLLKQSPAEASAKNSSEEIVDEEVASDDQALQEE